MNLLNYIEKYKDIDFKDKPLTKIDSLIFSVLSYENFDDLLHNPLTIKDVSNLFFTKYSEKELRNRVSFTNKSYEILKMMASSIRYQNLILSNYINIVDEKQNIQFSAITLQHKNLWRYVAFRGTDNTIVGWKEDFMMCYSDEIMSQSKAVDYLNQIDSEDSIFRKYIKPIPIYCGGHSKGGNIAMYASAFCHLKIQKRIIQVDNFDGPGFSDKIWKKKEMVKVVHKINTYIPESSIFGRLFMHEEVSHIISSNEVGLMQHDAFSWLIENDRFIYKDQLNECSNTAINKLNEMLSEYDKPKRHEIIHTIFEMIYRLDIHTLQDIKEIGLSKGIQLVQEIVGLENEQKKILIEIIQVMFEITFEKIF